MSASEVHCADCYPCGECTCESTEHFWVCARCGSQNSRLDGECECEDPANHSCDGEPCIICEEERS